VVGIKPGLHTEIDPYAKKNQPNILPLSVKNFLVQLNNCIITTLAFICNYAFSIG
jgi:hypothetical protein